MKLGHQRIRAGGDNGTRVDDVICNLTAFPKTGKGHGLVVSLVDEMWDLRVSIALPLVKAASRY
jgi:hypothetical protein